MRFTALVVVGDGNGHVGAELEKQLKFLKAIPQRKRRRY